MGRDDAAERSRSTSNTQPIECEWSVTPLFGGSYMLRLLLSLLVFVVFAPLTFAQDGSDFPVEDPSGTSGSGYAQNPPSTAGTSNVNEIEGNDSAKTESLSHLAKMKSSKKSEIVKLLVLKYPGSEEVDWEKLLDQNAPEISRLVNEFLLNQ